jgi:hypothetical protein
MVKAFKLVNEKPPITGRFMWCLGKVNLTLGKS